MLEEPCQKILSNTGEVKFMAETTIKGNMSTKSKVNLKGNLEFGGRGGHNYLPWGHITGDIENQNDLMSELHDRDNRPMTIQEIEKILYLD